MAVHTLEPTAYLEHLGLEQNPFPYVPDANAFFHSAKIDTLVMELLHAISSRKGFMVLTGEIGLGKTTIGRRLLKTLDEHDVATALVFNTFVQGEELLEAINADFGITDAGASLREKLDALNHFLIQRNLAGGNCALIIDDAQNLTTESLELIRLISNLETESEKLVQILLIGQPELSGKLDSRELRQLKSRIALSLQATPFSYEETKQYIYFKLNAAGDAGGIVLPDGALRTVYGLTSGNPRRLNMLMDRCLYAICAHSSKRISKQIVREAANELQFTEKKRSGRRMAYVLAVILALAAVSTLLLPDSMVRALLHPAAETAATNPAPAAAETATAPSPEVSSDFIKEFLSFYDLARYQETLMRSLDSGELKPLAGLIQKETGQQMVSLENPPPAFVGEHYSLLEIRLADGNRRFLLFWKPDYKITAFHENYAGEEILSLQKQLQSLNYYRFNLDGIVGKHLIKALQEFQSQQHIPASGQPDTQTLFLLAQTASRQS